MAIKKDQFMIIYSVLAAAIVVLCIALVPIAIDAMRQSNEVATPGGSFGDVSVKSRYEIMVYLNDTDPATNYSECRIGITTPDNEKTTLELTEGKYTYSLTGVLSRLTELRIHDGGTPGVIDGEDYLTLFHNYPIQIGVWTLQLVFKASGKDIASRPVVAPDITSHPTGDFLSASKINEAKFKVVVGIISPPTDYAYCRIMLDPPGTAEEWMPRYFNLTEATEQTFFYGSQIRITLTAQNQYGLPQTGDTIEVTSTSSSLPLGQYTVSLVYRFDGGRIAVKVFTMGA